MKIISVIGTRPEIIKMSALFEQLERHFEHKILHTGQHYNPEMDSEIFKELKLPPVDYLLKTGSGSFDVQITKQIQELHQVLKKEMPDIVLVQGDTNTAMTATLVALRLGIKVGHIESGCRSGDPQSPEEQNRKIIDSICHIHFCSDLHSMNNLIREGKTNTLVYTCGPIFDSLKRSSRLSTRNYYQELGLRKNHYAIVTLHRAEGMIDVATFMKKVDYLNWVASLIPIIFPIHPRTNQFLKDNNIQFAPQVKIIPAITHLPFINLLRNCKIVLTDSGGIQEEAAYFNRPCLILRNATEWQRLIKIKKNFLLKNLDLKDQRLTQRLLEDPIFYKKAQSKICPESKTGAWKVICNTLKKIR